jgi:hypothetical protein
MLHDWDDLADDELLSRLINSGMDENMAQELVASREREGAARIERALNGRN